MNEHDTNEHGTNEHDTNESGGKLFGWITKYSDEEKYPKKPTPWFVYVLSVPAGLGLTWLEYLGMKSLFESIGRANDFKCNFTWTIGCILFLSSVLFFVSLYQCFARYGFGETLLAIPKVFLLALLIALFGALVVFFFISPYFGVAMGAIFFGLLLQNSFKIANRK